MNDRVESLLLDMLGDYSSSSPASPCDQEPQKQQLHHTQESHAHNYTQPLHTYSAPDLESYYSTSIPESSSYSSASNPENPALSRAFKPESLAFSTASKPESPAYSKASKRDSPAYSTATTKPASPAYSTAATSGSLSPISHTSLVLQNQQLMDTLQNLQHASANAYEHLSALRAQAAAYEDERNQFLAQISHLTHSRNRMQVRLDEKENLLSRVSGAIRKAKSEFAELHRQLDLETRRRVLAESQLEVARNRLRVVEASNLFTTNAPPISLPPPPPTDCPEQNKSSPNVHHHVENPIAANKPDELRAGLVDAVKELRHLTALALARGNSPKQPGI